MDIRNICIIAHIDHGKSTLADRLLELTNTVEARNMREQVLDQMELEREKGITIKLQPVRMEYDDHVINLIDTPGHVDFQYEVSRSLASVEGALLLVDATQGVQAQTLSNLYAAIEAGLEIIPVINKIDLPAADVPKVSQEIVNLLGGRAEDILQISAKTGDGVETVLQAVVEHIPAPEVGDAGVQPLRALVFDSVYDDYKGVVAYIRVLTGQLAARDEIAFLGTGATDRAVEIGVFRPAMEKVELLAAGEIGYVATGLKDVRQARVGDTLTLRGETPEPVAGFSVPQAKVFAGVYPADADQLPRLREAIAALQLNDSSLQVQPEQNEVLGQGFRCGFLGMLHLEIIQERLQREWDLELVVTTPSVAYRVVRTDGAEVAVHTPSDWPDPSQIESIHEQYVKVEVVTPGEYMGAVFDVMSEHEAQPEDQEHLDSERVVLRFVMPLRELVVDLYDRLKSATSGYASMGYEVRDERAADVVRLDVLVNHEIVSSLSVIVARSRAEQIGRRIVAKLKEVLPRQLFAVPLQAAIGGSIIARETLPAARKDVTGHLYGGDVSRKRKLLEKQKKGKKKLAASGSVEIPARAYIDILKR